MPHAPRFDPDAVLERARDLFWERGYSATSIQDLERALGIKRSSIYNTFGDKRGLYDRTLERYQADNLGRLRQSLETTDDLRAALTELLVGAARQSHPDCQTGARGCYIVNATTELANSCTEALTFVADNRRRFVALLSDAIVAARDRGHLATDTDAGQWANFLFVFYSGLNVVVQTRIEREALVESVKSAVGALPWVARSTRRHSRA